MKENNPIIVSSGLLALALVICAIILSYTWRQNNSASQTITVTGSAKKDITSDLAFLRGSISAQAPTAGEAFRRIEEQKPALTAYLESNGFPKDKITFFPVISNPLYEISSTGMATNNIIGYNYSQRIEISSGDVNKIKAISLDISSLINKGVAFSVEMPEYHYTKLADLKISIQAEAAKDALNRAERIAKATDRTLGPLRTARMGILQITPRYSNMISDYGINDLSSIEKEITAVVSASFEIN